jgi:hypothetical protein
MIDQEEGNEMGKDEMTAVEMLQTQLLVVLQAVVQELGPVPDKYGSYIKDTIGRDDRDALITLGHALENCLREESYLPLSIVLADTSGRRVLKLD